MGFLDHLFKLKQSDEKMGEGETGAAAARTNGEHADAAPDPGAFLHPKYFATRNGGSLPATARSAAPVAKGPPPAQEIVLTLGDVLSRIPTRLLRAGFHDANRELRFSIDDLSADIARGRAAVPLSKIAALCPDIFARNIAPSDDPEIRLPLQKLVEQIGLLRGRPATPPSEPSTLPVPAPSICEDMSPAPPPPAESAAEPPEIGPTPSSLPAVHVFTPPPPPVIAEPAAEAAPEHPLRESEPDASPPESPVPMHETSEPGIRIHPPPLVRPILVPPPTLLRVSAHPPEPPAASDPGPPVEIARTPDRPTRFPQEALQALFMTDEALDLAAVSRHAAALPGVRACALEWHGESALAGDTPAGFDLAALHAAASLHDGGSLPVGPLESVTLHGEQAAISIFARPGVLLAVLHRPLPPGVRERLASVASTLARL